MHRRLIALVIMVVFAAVATAAAFVDRTAAAPKPPFPVVVGAANGAVTIQKRPQRIVSVSPTATESLFAVGAGPQVVAVDAFSDYPSGTPKTSLSGFRPNVEAIAAYKPDLVIVSFDSNNVVAGLTRLGIPVLYQPAANSLGDVYAQIVNLGRATGNAERARTLVRSMKARILNAVASARRLTRPGSVYHELSPDHYSATSKTFIGRVYTLFGLRNIADEAGATSGSDYPKLSPEYILAANPALIVLADTTCCGQNRATVSARPGWNRIDAVRRGAIVAVNDSIASRWGPRVVNFVRAVESALRSTHRR